MTTHDVAIGGGMIALFFVLWLAYWWYAAGAFYRKPRPYTAAYDREFSRVRRQVLDRDGHRCTRCGSGRRLEVHHRIPRRAGGSNLPSNLVTLCDSCHHLAHHP